MAHLWFGWFFICFCKTNLNCHALCPKLKLVRLTAPVAWPTRESRGLLIFSPTVLEAGKISVTVLLSTQRKAHGIQEAFIACIRWFRYERGHSWCVRCMLHSSSLYFSPNILLGKSCSRTYISIYVWALKFWEASYNHSVTPLWLFSSHLLCSALFLLFWAWTLVHIMYLPRFIWWWWRMTQSFLTNSTASM